MFLRSRALILWCSKHDFLIIGFAQERNAASRRVLEKVGMTYVDVQLVSSIPTAFYRFERSQRLRQPLRNEDGCRAYHRA